MFVSFDRRRTWKQINAPALGHIQEWAFVTPTAGIALTGQHGRGQWEPFGPPTSGGQTLSDLFLSLPFIHVDATDHVYFVDGHRVLRSSQPVH